MSDFDERDFCESCGFEVARSKNLSQFPSLSEKIEKSTTSRRVAGKNRKDGVDRWDENGPIRVDVRVI